MKVGIIGHYGDGGNYTDGQTVKTKEIDKYLAKQKEYIVTHLDTRRLGKNPFRIYFGCKKMLNDNDAVILIVSSNGYRVLAPLLVSLNKKTHKKLLDIVIGGSRHKLYDKYNQLINTARQFNRIFVETPQLERECRTRNLKNISVLPNFKDIQIIDNHKKPDKKSFRLCTFSRVCKEKGIEDAIKATELANSKIGSKVFSLDIYGKVDKEYSEAFATLQKNFPDYIRYAGAIAPEDSSTVIAQYDAMLFLTFWRGEGFPGTLIDAMAAGVPVLATDWGCNKEVLEIDSDSELLTSNNIDEISDKIINLYNKYDKIKDIRKHYRKISDKYLPDEAIQPLLAELST